MGLDELHFEVKVFMKRPSLWEWLCGSKRVARAVIVYERDGPTTVATFEGCELVTVKGPHDRI